MRSILSLTIFTLLHIDLLHIEPIYTAHLKSPHSPQSACPQAINLCLTSTCEASLSFPQIGNHVVLAFSALLGILRKMVPVFFHLSQSNI